MCLHVFSCPGARLTETKGKGKKQMNYQLTFTKEQISVSVPEGTTVLEGMRMAGLVPDAPCGGQGKCKKCRVRINGTPALACRTTIYSDMEIETEDTPEKSSLIMMEGAGREVLFSPGELPGEVDSPILAAVDLGSTSLVVYLMDGVTGKQLSVKSMLNPQRQYGADVVSRCSYALENGAHILSRCVREGINLLLREASLACGRSREDIVRIVMVGNACMHHLFLEISTETLVVAPYRPKVLEAVSVSATECGIHAHPAASVKWLPNIGGFVGADTMACILACEMEKREEITLMVDIGTNGEMVLGNREGLIACSTAAGPAFEGARISCGMRGSAGAIDHVYLENGQIK